MRSLKKYLKSKGVLWLPTIDEMRLNIQTKDVPKIEKHIARYYKNFEIVQDGVFEDISSIQPCQRL